MLHRLTRWLQGAPDEKAESPPPLARLRWPVLGASGPGASTGRRTLETDDAPPGPGSCEASPLPGRNAQEDGRRRSAA